MIWLLVIIVVLCLPWVWMAWPGWDVMKPSGGARMKNLTVQQLLAVWVIGTFTFHLALWMFVSPYMPPIPEKVLGLLQGMLGLHGGWAAMNFINYYFSSSASSARKDEIIAASSPPPRPPEAP